MRRLLKAVASPLRRRLAARRVEADKRLDRLVRVAVWDVLQPHLAEMGASLNRIESMRGVLPNIEQSINIARCNADASAADTNLVLDGVVRELARLQRQVDELREAVEGGVGLALVSEERREVA